MKKILVAIAIVGGVAAVSPVMAQHHRPAERTERRDNRFDQPSYRMERDRDRVDNRREERGASHWRKGHGGGGRGKAMHGKRHGGKHCKGHGEGRRHGRGRGQR